MGCSGFRLLAAMFVTLLVAACSSGPDLAPSAPIDPAAACMSELNRLHVEYDRVRDWHTAEGCGISQAIRVRRSAIPWNRAALMTCPFEERMWTFETQVVQPAARRYFGRNVQEIIHYGTYNCRGERGSNHTSRLSQHSFGNAIDIAGFKLDDGEVVTVRHDWYHEGPRGEFLHDVAKGACRVFHMVLTPKSNPLHRDHMHLDMGPYRHCAA